MDNSRTLLNLVLDTFSRIKDIVTNTEDIVSCTEEISENDVIADVVKKTKTLVDTLYEHSDDLKKSFDKYYDELEKPEEISENELTVNGYKSNKNNEDSEVDNDSSDSQNAGEGNSINDRDGDLDETVVVNPDDTLVFNTDNKCPKSNEESKGNVDEVNDDKENKSAAPKLKIRVVDLNKLIDPKPKKSVKFDSSVIILTSSDEDSTTPSKKKGSSTEQNSNLRSALKNSSPKNENKDKSCEKDREDDSDSSKPRNEHRRNKKSNSIKSEKEGYYSDNEKKHDTRQKNRKNNDENHKSDPEKNSDSECDNAKSDEEGDKNTSEQNDSDKNDSLNHSRSSGRIRSMQKQIMMKREKLKKIFRRNSDESFSISEGSEKNSSKNGRSLRSKSIKKANLVATLSDSSNSSDSESPEQKRALLKKSIKKETLKKSSIASEKEDKFGRKVYVPLPLIECEKLKEVYLRNKEILEIRSLTNLDSLKRSKKSSRVDSKSSSDSEKPKTKKFKSKKAGADETDSSVEKETGSSDDEPLAKIISPPETADVDDDEILAEIVMKVAKSADDVSRDSTDGEDSESEKSQKKSKTNKKGCKDDIDGSEEDVDKDSVDAAKGDNSIEEKDEEVPNDPAKDISDKEDEDTDEDAVAKQDESIQKNEEEVPSNPAKDVSDNEDVTSKEKSVEKDDEKESDKNTDDGDDSETKKSKKKNADWKKDKLLTEKMDSTDSEEEFSKYCKKKDNKSKSDIVSDEEVQPSIIRHRKAKKRIVDSDDSDENEKKEKKQKESSDVSSQSEDEKAKSSDSEEKEEEETGKKKPARRRVKRIKNSSSSDDDKSTRKQIRKVLDRDSLSETTKKAEAEEKERKARIAEKQKKYNCYFEEKMDATIDNLVLEYDEETKEEQLAVNKKIAKKLKPHQANGIQFMWDACFESIKRAKKTAGSGCILAHCMGLGKTLQVVALTHTLLTNSEKTNVRKVLVVCPLSTVLNWKNEFKKWVPTKFGVEVYELITSKKNYEKQYVIKEWHDDGGVLIIGYQMFRNLSNPDNRRISKKMRTVFYEGLVDPGPDLVVCDEGHLLKNEKTSLSIAMNRIKTLRRIVLTGTPLQNNLREYWCMVQFIKPNLLGSYKEYLNRFVNPIVNGQYTDSTQHDILLMRKRSHVLHKLLDGVVQRRDYAVLEPYLPPKFEYVLFVALTETQVKLYNRYMERYARKNDGSNRTSFLFIDFQMLQRICTHPRVLKDKSNERKEKEYDEEEDSEGSLKDFIDDGGATSEESAKSTSSSGSSGDEDNEGGKKAKVVKKARVTRAQAAQRKENGEEDSEPEAVEVPREWWQDICDGDELEKIDNGGKLILLFEILKECEEIGDKVLVFSQSLYTLNCIEHFLERIDEATQAGESEKVDGHKGSWARGLDYFRLDGTSSSENRSAWCDSFNNPNNLRSRLFLISTKAGGLGINLVAANRVIIFDVSWNPSHDLQSIYRVYRFGQTKPSYVYRFVTYGTMEMKIYDRQVIKQAISKRVIDEQQIDRHYNQNDIQELYKCDLEPKDRPIPMVPKDVLLGELLQKHDRLIYKYHLHQSLLENKEAEGLNEEERKAAWDEFENEKVLRKYNYGVNATPQYGVNSGVSAQAIAGALTNIVRKDNPNWSEVQIKGIIPALVQQLQVQLQENDTTMYNRVLQEIQLMRMERMKEAYYQNQMMRMIQNQQKSSSMLGNMALNPVQLANLLTQRPANSGGPSSSTSNARATRPNEVIELND